MSTVPGAALVLIAHTAVACLLIGSGGVLVALHDVTQETFLAMVSGGLGLLSGGGTALALHHALGSGTK